MKALAPKSSSPSTSNHFFKKNENGSFFGQESEAKKPFFTPSTIQPKLSIGQADDKYDQQADSEADDVVERIGPNRGADSIQRKCEACERENSMNDLENTIQRFCPSIPPGNINLKPVDPSSASFQEIASLIMRYVKYAAIDLPFGAANLVTASLALAIIIYYHFNKPEPDCGLDHIQSSEMDKWKHCYIGCKLSFWIPGGFQITHVIALLKEVYDCLHNIVVGKPEKGVELKDVTATLRGVYTCGVLESCNDCCCDKVDIP